MTRGGRFTCYYCGQKEPCTKDHFYPKSRGGILIVYACHVCQRVKGDMHPLMFVEYVNGHNMFTFESKVRIARAVNSLWQLYLNGEVKITKNK